MVFFNNGAKVITRLLKSHLVMEALEQRLQETDCKVRPVIFKLDIKEVNYLKMSIPAFNIEMDDKVRKTDTGKT